MVLVIPGEHGMNDRSSNQYIRQALEFARRLTVLADKGEEASTDTGCAVLYCVVRDCAYKIRASAEREREAHRQSGRWEGGAALAYLGSSSEKGAVHT